MQTNCTKFGTKRFALWSRALCKIALFPMKIDLCGAISRTLAQDDDDDDAKVVGGIYDCRRRETASFFF